MTAVPWIRNEEVAARLSMAACLPLLERAFRELAENRCHQPLRSAIRIPGTGNLLGLMPGVVDGAAGAKVLSICPENHRAGLPSHQGVVLVFDARDGRLRGIVDAERLPALRTAGVSALATRLLANPGPARLALLGAGVQAAAHLEAMALVRDIEQVSVWDLDPSRSEAFAVQARLPVPFPVVATASAEEAVRTSDLICTLTPSKVPVVADRWIGPGTHLNAIGACTPDARELEGPLMARARVYTDRMESLRAESGDFLLALAEGHVGETHPRGELGELLTSRIEGRTSPEEVTVFKALGLAVCDLALAAALL